MSDPDNANDENLIDDHSIETEGGGGGGELRLAFFSCRISSIFITYYFASKKMHSIFD